MEFQLLQPCTGLRIYTATPRKVTMAQPPKQARLVLRSSSLAVYRCAGADLVIYRGGKLVIKGVSRKGAMAIAQECFREA